MLVGERTTEVTLEHDEQWSVHDEISAQFKAASGEENCYAVATNLQHGKWGVGFHAGKKGWETAAMVALTVAIAKGTEAELVLRSKYVKFAQMLDGGQSVVPRGPSRQFGATGRLDESAPSVLGTTGSPTSSLGRKPSQRERQRLCTTRTIRPSRVTLETSWGRASATPNRRTNRSWVRRPRLPQA